VGRAFLTSRDARLTAFRISMLTGAAIGALLSGPALAQETAPEGVTFSADQATRDSAGNLAAQGSVEAHFRERTLRADRLTHDPANGVITAAGDVQIFQPDGSAEFADSLVFTDDLQTGVARGFSARLPQNGTLAADSIVRRDENHTELNRTIFTACDTCDADGKNKIPTWSISADRVVQDKADHSINYRNAVIRIKGVPVLYAPFFSHADPTAARKSGLLAPDFSLTHRRGLSYEQPYLWSISPYQDLVISPQINTDVNPFLNLRYRRRFYSGDIEARFGYTYDRDFNSDGVQFGDDRTKAYVLASGDFRPLEDWRMGFTAEAAKDRRLFDQYSIDWKREDRGLFRADDRRLISQIYAVRQGDRSYLSIAAVSFQSLRTLSGPPNAFGVLPLEDNSVLPTVSPLVEFRYEPEGPIAGGRLRLQGSGVWLERDLSPVFIGQPGTDSRRATVEADWRRAFTLAGGTRFEPFANMRGDVYSVSDLSPGNLSARNASRAIPTIGLDATWPLVRQRNGVTTIIEPIVQIALSPDTKINPDIPNEDGVAFDFDDTNLFEFNKFPGFDLYEGGQRINAGVATSVDWGDQRSLRVIVGQSFRNSPDPAFPARTGLNKRSSDWVASAEFTPIAGLSMFARTRFDDADLQKIEGGLNASFAGGGGYLRYMRAKEDFSGRPREDIEGAGEVFVTKNWGVVVDAVRDLEQKQWRRRSAGVVYRDECLRFEVLYQRDNNPVLGTSASQSVVVRLTLATLGDTGYRNYQNR